MRDYNPQIEKLRYCAAHFSCDGCVGGCVTGSNEPRTAFVLNDAADAIEELLAAVQKWNPVSEPPKEKGDYWCNVDDMMLDSIGVYNEEEIHENCTVQIWRNTVTGETSVGWWQE